MDRSCMGRTKVASLLLVLEASWREEMISAMKASTRFKSNLSFLMSERRYPTPKWFLRKIDVPSTRTCPLAMMAIRFPSISASSCNAAVSCHKVVQCSVYHAVCGEDNGCIVLAFLNEIPDFTARVWIHGTGWFIKKDKTR